MPRKPKLMLAAAAALVLLVLAFSLLLFPRQKPVYLHDGPNKFKITRWEVLAGTNAVLRSDARLKQWGRRQLDKVGIRLKGARGDVAFNTFNPDAPNYHILAIHFEGESPGPEFSSRFIHDYDYLDEKGNKVYLTSVGSFAASPGWERFLLTYTTIFGGPDPAVLPHACSDGTCPRQLRIIRKSNGQEVLTLPVVH